MKVINVYPFSEGRLWNFKDLVGEVDTQME